MPYSSTRFHHDGPKIVSHFLNILSFDLLGENCPSLNAKLTRIELLFLIRFVTLLSSSFLRYITSDSSILSNCMLVFGLFFQLHTHPSTSGSVQNFRSW